MARTSSIIDRLPDEGRRALAELALREYRDLDDQAAYIIVEALRRAGALPIDDQLATTAPHGPVEAA